MVLLEQKGDFKIVQVGGSATNTNSGISRISSFNSHDWFGGIISSNKKRRQTLTLTLDFGIDARTSKGIPC